MDGQIRNIYKNGVSNRYNFETPTRCSSKWRYPKTYIKEENLPPKTTGKMPTVLVMVVNEKEEDLLFQTNPEKGCYGNPKKNHSGHTRNDPTG